MTVRTFSPKAADIQRQWHVIDASDVVLGRLAVQAATLLRGKHKPIFAPHVDTGDFVIIVNAAKVALSGNKLRDKMAYRHSGYPGGLRSMSYAELMAKSPERAVEKAVKGMLPKNSLGRSQLRKLKVYAGPRHPHQAQLPTPFEITQIDQQAPAASTSSR
jgi:large subunit ribosomal protein L13